MAKKYNFNSALTIKVTFVALVSHMLKINYVKNNKIHRPEKKQTKKHNQKNIQTHKKTPTHPQFGVTYIVYHSSTTHVKETKNKSHKTKENGIQSDT